MRVDIHGLSKGNRLALPKGSPDWCIATLTYLHRNYEHDKHDIDLILSIIDEILEARVWEVVPEDEPYGNADEMFRDVIGITLDELAAQFQNRLQKKKVVAVGASAKHGEVGNGRSRLVDNNSTQTTTEYTASRLKRDSVTDPVAAEALADLTSGSISAAEARRRAGFAPRGKRVFLHDDPQRAAETILARFGNAWCEELADALRK